jgi:DNA-binding NarL/FixJ family response regulator
MSGKKASSVLIVDDHPVVREGLRQLLADDSALRVCGDADSAAACMSILVKSPPDIILADISLNGSDGIELVKDIRRMNPNVPVLMFSFHAEEIYAERALIAGANGYVMKQESAETVLKAIHQVLAGEVFLSVAMTNRMLQKISGNPMKSGTLPGEVEQLSDRELEVFELIGHGYSTRRIAETLNLSIKTIETYRLHIKEKMGLNDATELMHHAVHWITVESANGSTPSDKRSVKT